MCLSILAYFLSLTAVLVVKYFRSLKTHELPNPIFAKGVIKIESFLRHKIFVGDCAMLIVDKTIHLKQGDKHVAITNVGQPKLLNGYLYFTGCGMVTFSVNNFRWYKYLQMDICSNLFNLNPLKRQAGIEVLNNLFNIRACVSLKRYIRFVKCVLKVELNVNGVVVKQNAYKLPFSIGYNSRGREKRIFFNQTV